MNNSTYNMSFSKLYRNAIQSMPTGFVLHEVVLDDKGQPADFIFIEVNPAFELLSGLKGVDILGQRVTQIFRREGSFWIEQFKQAPIGNEIRTIVHYSHKIARHLKVSFHCPEIGLLACYVEDINEHIKLEQAHLELERERLALRESEETFRAHVENSFDVIFTLDSAGTFVFVSPAWERHFGYPASTVIGKSFAPTVHPDDIQPCVEYLTHILSTGQSGTSPVYRVKCANGTLRSFVANGMPYIDTKGQLLFIGVGHDVTDQLKAENDRLEFERKLLHTQKLESLGVMAGGIAHDFNNLLQAIQGNLELALTEVPATSESRDYILNSLSAIRHATDLSTRMLAYSGKGHFVVEPLNLNQLITENSVILRTAVPRTISIDLHTSNRLPCIMADIAQLQQVVMNLITNAAEAIEQQPGKIRLTTGIRNLDRNDLAKSCMPEKPNPGSFVVLEVSDSGIGMSAETIDRIFDPFFTTKFTGRGLGMSAVQGIIQGHKGALFIESAPGCGTTIIVAFPAITNSADITHQPSALNESSPPTPKPAVLSGVAMVVDDDKSVLKMATTMARICGLSPVTACDGYQAVSRFQKLDGKVDVVIMDLTMPNMDGITAMRELRQIRPDIKIILCSGFNEQEMNERYDGNYPTGFLRKPYSLNELETELRRVMIS